MNLTVLKSFILSPGFKNAVRASIACMIAIALDRYLKLPYGYWALLTTVIIMQANLGASINKAQQRIIGTILGVLVGVMLGVVFQQYFAFFAVIIPILVFLTIYALPFSYTVAIFFASIMVIILLAYHNPAPWIFVSRRIMDTLMGAGIGLGVSLIFWPSWAREDFSLAMADTIEACEAFFSTLLGDFIDDNKSDRKLIELSVRIETLLKQTQQRFEDFTHEPSAITLPLYRITAILYSLERIHNLLLGFLIIKKDTAQYAFCSETKSMLSAFEKEARRIVTQLIHALKENKSLPNIESPYKTLTAFHQLMLKPKYQGSYKLALLYRNLYAYFNELKHIKEAIAQIRKARQKNRA